MLKIEYVDVAKLKPYDKNTRKHEDYDVSQIAKSIEQYGFNDPIGIWGKDNIIVEGHGRLLAAKKLGMDKVPCIRLDDLTDEQRREYAIMHNKTAELSMWDFDLLAAEIPELDFSGFDVDWGLPQANPYDDEECVPDDYDEEMLKQYEDHSQEFLAKQRVMITYSPEQEEALFNFLGVDKKKVVYTFEELLGGNEDKGNSN